MTEETPPVPAAQVNGGGQANQQQVSVQVDVSKMEQVYTNFFRLSLSSSFEEILVDLGMHSGIMIPGGMEPITLTHRMVLNPFAAKRLAESLRQLIGRYEQLFGVLETDTQRRFRTPPRQG